tara:strand:+ start:1597 stop:2490 length:894 start_codon:yes stop_codon:yes gene_type:complete
MRTLTEQYRSVKEGKGPKDVFLKEAKRQFPNLVTNRATFKEASTILKQKGIISENFVGMPMVGNPIERKKESYETAFANFIAEAEAKAEEKKVSKEVEETEEHNYNYKDKKDPNNMIFGQIQMGYYYEMKQEKNADKTIDEIKDIVFKNLAKDPIYYTKNGQFGEDVGYTEDNVSLGVPKEAKGKYKESGYGNLNEHSITLAGGIVTGGGFTSANYKDFFGLSEAEDDKEDLSGMSDTLDDIEGKVDSIASKQMFEADAPIHIEALVDAAEAAYDAGMSTDEILEFIEQHLGLKMGD